VLGKPFQGKQEKEDKDDHDNKSKSNIHPERTACNVFDHAGFSVSGCNI
jgi:hypothetical protein